MDDGFQLHPPRIGIGMAEAQDQRPGQNRRNAIERETEDRGVKAALNARGGCDIHRVRAFEGARQMLQQPLRHFCVIEPMHRDNPCRFNRGYGSIHQGADKRPFGAKIRTHVP